MRALALTAIASVVLSGCGADRLRPLPKEEAEPVAGLPPPPPPETPPPVVPASTCQTAALKGRVCVPGTDDGLAGAAVWVSLVDCHGQLLRFDAETRWTGEFALGDMPAGDAELHVQLGSFSAVVPIHLLPGRVNLFEDPTNQTTCVGPPPSRAALIEGEFDPVRRVLTGLGLGTDAYSAVPVNGVPSPAHELLSDYQAMKQYDVLFFPCGEYTRDIFSYHVEGTVPDVLSFNYDTLIHENVRLFLQEGGDVYVSDWNWPFVEMLDPDALDFYGDETDATETLVGYAEDRVSDVEDPALGTFLAQQKVLVRFDYHGWALLESTAQHVKTHVRADVHTAVPADGLAWAPPERLEVEGAPLVVSFKPFAGGGRVIFTTFHLRQGEDDRAMREVLEYLLYKL